MILSKNREKRARDLSSVVAVVMFLSALVASTPQARASDGQWHNGSGESGDIGRENVEAILELSDDVEYESVDQKIARSLSLIPTLVGVVGGATMLGFGLRLGSPTLAIGGLVLGLGSVIVGPSLGHFYADNLVQAWVGIGVRTLLLTSFALFLTGTLIGGVPDTDCMYGIEEDAAPCDSGSFTGFVVLTAISGLGLLASMVVDIATTPAAARRADERRRKTAVAVRPILLGRGKDISGFGLGVSGVF